MADQLSGIAIIICIAFGLLTVILLFIFAKRQITRFTLKSRRGPHVPIAHDAPKKLREEIERRLEIISNMRYKPKMVKKEDADLFLKEETISRITPTHLYRQKALDDLSILDILSSGDPVKPWNPDQDLRSCLIHLFHLGPLSSISLPILHKFVDLYEHARHDPSEFAYSEYYQYREILYQIKQSLPQPYASSRKTSCNQGDLTSASTSASDVRKPVPNGKTNPNMWCIASPSIKNDGTDKNLTFETSV